MGVAKKSEITIEFDSIPLGITSKTALEQSLLSHYRKTTGNETKPSITITDFEMDGNVINLTLYSDREVNLDFQLELLQSYLNEHKGKVIEFYFDNWINQC